ncbi:MAG TPA: tripartite tricarboxylate transporter permease [Burkholderiales bacterium]|nr:tripartite tricarboxylate transporter permease [Burkholderiales bacterium]
MLDTLLTALATLFTPQHFLFLGVGVVVGMAIGILPGLGGIAGLSLLLPFLYGMNEVSALAMLVGLIAVINTSDTFTSVLMGIPGSSASQATVVDGFPLAQQGHAARALGAAFSASLMGGLFGALLLTAAVLVARPVILAFSSAEMFMLAVFGMSMVGVLAGASLAKGLAACGIGLVLGSIGPAPATGVERMYMGMDYLRDGLPLVVVALGLFAFPEIVDLLRLNRPIAKANKLGSGWVQGFRDSVRHWFIVVRCSGLGALVGAIPGLGGSVVDWIAYGHVVQTSRDKSKFGSGDIRGVVAPEAANNACQGGALMPTLLFGVPGSGSMAIFLAGLVLLGIEPGPSMVGENLSLSYTVVWSLALANVIGAGLCLLLAGPIARLTLIPFTLIAPFMMVVITFAAFQARRDLSDLVLLLGVGLVGILLRRFGWPRPAVLIGFVLAPQAETYLYQAVQFYSWGFLARPGVLIILAITALSVLLGSRSRVGEEGVVRGGALGEAVAPQPKASQRRPQILFAAGAVALFVFAVLDSLQHTFLAAVFPVAVGAASLLAGGYVLWAVSGRRVAHPANQDQEVTGVHVGDPAVASPWSSFAWFAALFALAALLGYILAVAVFFLVFVRKRAHRSWTVSIAYTVAMLACVLLLGRALSLDFPRGLLQAYVDLPWPFN